MTQVFKIDPIAPQRSKIQRAAQLLNEGALIAFPTETVYGLGASLFDEGALKRVYEIKHRPNNKPLTVHIADLKNIERLVGEIPPLARKFIDCYWPGPLTIILKSKISTTKRGGFAKFATKSSESAKYFGGIYGEKNQKSKIIAEWGGRVGFRMPKCEIALRLIEESHIPLVAPSANLSGAPPPKTAQEVINAFDGVIEAIIDGGPTQLGVESTVIDLTVSPPKILREAAISKKQLAIDGLQIAE